MAVLADPACWVCEFTDAVDLQSYPSFAHFAPSDQEPMDQLVAFDGGRDRFQIGYDSGALTGEWYSTEAGDRRFLPLLAVHGDLETSPALLLYMWVAGVWYSHSV